MLQLYPAYKPELDIIYTSPWACSSGNSCTVPSVPIVPSKVKTLDYSKTSWIASNTKAVFAIWEELSPFEAVGVVGIPLKSGELIIGSS